MKGGGNLCPSHYLIEQRSVFRVILSKDSSPSNLSLNVRCARMYLVWRAPCLVCDLLPCADLKTGLFPEEILDSVDETGELVPD